MSTTWDGNDVPAMVRFRVTMLTVVNRSRNVAIPEPFVMAVAVTVPDVTTTRQFGAAEDMRTVTSVPWATWRGTLTRGA